MSEQTELVVQSNAVNNPSALLALAIQKDLDIAKLEKLMEMQERWEANQAKKTFVKAMAAFKENPPKIVKDMLADFQTEKGRVKYRHASLGNVTAKITEGLSKHGLSTRWEQNQEGDMIAVTCIVTHIDGHSEQTTVKAKPDNSGAKNAIQAIGSAITYLERYTLLAICGIATNEFENDGKTIEACITKEQEAALQEWIETIQANKENFLKYMAVESLAKIPAKQFEKALNALKSKAKKEGIE